MSGVRSVGLQLPPVVGEPEDGKNTTRHAVRRVQRSTALNETNQAGAWQRQRPHASVRSDGVGRGGRLAVAGRRAAPLEAAADTDESSGFALGLRATASYASGVRFRPEIPFGAARLLADFEPWKNLLLLQNRLFDQGSPRF